MKVVNQVGDETRPVVRNSRFVYRTHVSMIRAFFTGTRAGKEFDRGYEA